MVTRRAIFASLATSLGVVAVAASAEAATKSTLKKKRPVHSAKASRTAKASTKKPAARS